MPFSTDKGSYFSRKCNFGLQNSKMIFTFVPLKSRACSLFVDERPAAFIEKGEYQSGQMGQTVNLLAYAFGGSNPILISGGVRQAKGSADLISAWR